MKKTPEKQFNFDDVYKMNIILFISVVLSECVPLLIGGYIKQYFGEDTYNSLFCVDSYVRIILEIIIQLFFILLTALVFVKILKKDYKKTLSLNKPSKVELINTFRLSIYLWILCFSLNQVFVALLSKVITLNSEPYMSQMPLLVNIIVIALIPAVCEEIMFRGALLDTYKKFGKKRAIIITSIFFALMHGSFTNIIPPLILALIAGYVIFSTKSIYLTMIIHFIFNSITVIIYNYLDKINSTTWINYFDCSTFLEMLLLLLISVLAVLRITSLLKKISKVNYKVEETEITNKELINYLKSQWAVYGFILINLMKLLSS